MCNNELPHLFQPTIEIERGEKAFHDIRHHRVICCRFHTCLDPYQRGDIQLPRHLRHHFYMCHKVSTGRHIAKALAELLRAEGFKPWLDSEVGRGTKITLFLPRDEEPT